MSASVEQWVGHWCFILYSTVDNPKVICLSPTAGQFFVFLCIYIERFPIPLVHNANDECDKESKT